MKNFQIQVSPRVRIVGLAVAVTLWSTVASADSIYLVSESGVFAANAPITAESAPNAAFSYSFLTSSTPVVNYTIPPFIPACGSACGFDAQFSDFTYTLNGTTVDTGTPDLSWFNTDAGGLIDLAFADGQFSLYGDQAYSGQESAPTILPGIYPLDPTQSVFELDMAGDGATPLYGDLEITATPEPSSLLLLGTGLAGLAAGLRRRLRTVSRCPKPLPSADTQ
jgi:hypothetical protein